ncbi:MAG: hypothetical protein UX16_C0012G0013 [Parcubacteria group bacterium GW2011_GWB1_45_7]|uniref:Secondary thiamine-phosphate synthase enzyme n=2 Tax=Candidatus Colwelliibacteriota TaxID=1817904 RepID=A0A1G1ZB42_9BACT|nr:MAG: hypothetical protein UX16_C0012G0013 [Parcubacteria group bacterium GW2011_GWB1_45_7]OGY61638.1 MAG: hypothetical protein A3I33_00930 [Candidatus Colwellbacteria bacterium RIFCSPLOWO2_02_FULL_45_11]OGY61862.1 MAG: hypothetical protein A3G58_01185 [Candidatus Colwellbacteria bacterium RIFCSPLOWO2_12_FULL_46_17]
MEKLTFSTKEKREVIDITDNIAEALVKLGAENGVCNLLILHTTAALTVGELEAGNGPDLLTALESIAPKLKYLHSEDPTHVGAHILSALIGSSLSLPVEDGKLCLGKWQRITLVELDGPRERSIDLTFISNG